MKQKSTILALAAVLVVVLFAAGCGSAPDTVSAAEPTAGSSSSAPLSFFGKKASTLTVPTGTLVSVRLQQSVSSASARPGEAFAAVLDEPLVSEGRTIAPRGATVTGRVVSAHKSGHLHHPAYLRLALVAVDVNGKELPMHTSSVFAQGGSHKKRNLALIGGGTGAGALIGAIAGGGKGALIGSAVGAGAGTVGAYATGEKNAGFGAERRLTFRLTQPLELKS